MKVPGPDRWMQLWREIAAKDAPLSNYQELVSLYSQSHRHYHTFDHISECLAELDSARHLARQPVVVELAIWYHDAIYDPRAPDNEERSAELARRRLAEAGSSADLCALVAALVMATKTHEPTLHPDAPLLVDIDLSILGQPEGRFQEYEAQIRREYAWVPEETFAAKRAEILERFLTRERIYTTALFFGKYEQRARANLLGSLRRLKPQLL